MTPRKQCMHREHSPHFKISSGKSHQQQKHTFNPPSREVHIYNPRLPMSQTKILLKSNLQKYHVLREHLGPVMGLVLILIKFICFVVNVVSVLITMCLLL